MIKLLSVARKNIISCDINDTVDVIAKILVKHNISSVFVKDNKDNKYIGLVDDRMLFRLLTTGENPIPKKAKDILMPLNKINGILEIDEAWREMENVKGEIFCVTNENGTVVGLVKKKTIGMLRLKYLKQKLGIIDI